MHVVFELTSLLEVSGGDHDLLQLAVHVNVEAIEFAAMMHKCNLRAPQHGSIEEGETTGRSFAQMTRLKIGPDRSKELLGDVALVSEELSEAELPLLLSQVLIARQLRVIIEGTSGAFPNVHALHQCLDLLGSDLARYLALVNHFEVEREHEFELFPFAEVWVQAEVDRRGIALNAEEVGLVGELDERSVDDLLLTNPKLKESLLLLAESEESVVTHVLDKDTIELDSRLLQLDERLAVTAKLPEPYRAIGVVV